MSRAELLLDSRDLPAAMRDSCGLLPSLPRDFIERPAVAGCWIASGKTSTSANRRDTQLTLRSNRRANSQANLAPHMIVEILSAANGVTSASLV